MRQEETSIGTVRFPDEVVFAFNPNRVSVWTDKSVTVSVARVNYPQVYTDTREPMGGGVEIDISKYLQAFVDKETRSRDVRVRLETEDGYYMFDVTVLWGAINIGEAYNEPRTTEWFANYPFKFELYVPRDATVQVATLNGSYTTIDIGHGLVEIDPTELFPFVQTGMKIKLTRGSSTTVWDYTFDHTFSEIVESGVSVYTLLVNKSECGHYLRWVDRHGKMQYYLFEKGVENQVDKAADMMTGVFTGESYEYLTSIYERKEATHNVMLCAPLVNKETFALLKTLNTAGVVELYYNGEWLPVNIEPLSVQEPTKADLVDYEVNMIFPVMMMQQL